MSTLHTITAAPARTMFAKRAPGFVAECGQVKQSGPTKDEAKSNLLGYLLKIEENHGKRTYIFCGDGSMLCVFWFGEGWSYDMVGGERTSTASCGMNPSYSREATIESAKAHAEQSFGGVLKVL